MHKETHQAIPNAPTAGVYIIWCRPLGKGYVGSTKDIQFRLKIHRQKLEKGTSHNKPLQKAWDEYGGDAFDFLVVDAHDTTDRRVADHKEQILLTLLKERGNAFNIAAATGQGRALDLPPKPPKPPREKRPKLTEEEKRARRREWRRANRDRLVAEKKKWYRANRDRLLAEAKMKRDAERAARPPKPKKQKPPKKRTPIGERRVYLRKLRQEDPDAYHQEMERTRRERERAKSPKKAERRRQKKIDAGKFDHENSRLVKEALALKKKDPERFERERKERKLKRERERDRRRRLRKKFASSL